MAIETHDTPIEEILDLQDLPTEVDQEDAMPLISTWSGGNCS